MPAREKVRSLLKALRAAYRWPGGWRQVDPVARAMIFLLARAGSTAAARRLLRRLLAQFVDWNDLRVARAAELEATLAAERAAEAREELRRALDRARRFLTALARTRRGMDLAFLARASSTEVRRFLAGLGVFEKEEVAVLAMLLGRAEKLALDEDAARVLRRLGLVPRRATRARTESLLGRAVEEGSYRMLYLLLREHALQRCSRAGPACQGCRLYKRCRSRGRF